MADLSVQGIQISQFQNDGASPSVLSTPIQEFYAGSKILVTGATGFVGKVLAEKLLRSCTHVDTIYYLVRPKRGLGIEERHEKLLTSTVFDRLREENPAALKKLVPLPGDVSDVDLGLSVQNRSLIMQNVNIVFHSAASVSFNEKIDSAFALNTCATIKVLDLCKSIKHLKALVHVSTAYSNSDKPEINEEVYPAPVELEKVLEVCKIEEEKQQEASVDAIRGRHPNTYTLTKALAESIVNEHAKDIPVCIVRPSIVTGALKEPTPGWVDNFSAVSGIMIEVGRGTLKSIICDETNVMDVIPVDLVVNTLITAGWRTGTQMKTEQATVYNCTSGALNPITWKNYGQLTEKYSLKYPSRHVMFYPGFSFRTNYVVHWIMTILFQVLPALILDTYFLITFKKRYALRLVKKFIDACRTGSFFSLHGWTFHCDNMLLLNQNVNKDSSDAETFPVDVRKINWEAYIEDYVVGLRVFALRDQISSLSGAKKKLQRIWWISTFFDLLIIGVFMYTLYSLTMYTFNSVSSSFSL